MCGDCSPRGGDGGDEAIGAAATWTGRRRGNMASWNSRESVLLRKSLMLPTWRKAVEGGRVVGG